MWGPGRQQNAPLCLSSGKDPKNICLGQGGQGAAEGRQGSASPPRDPRSPVEGGTPCPSHTETP